MPFSQSRWKQAGCESAMEESGIDDLRLKGRKKGGQMNVKLWLFFVRMNSVRHTWKQNAGSLTNIKMTFFRVKQDLFQIFQLASNLNHIEWIGIERPFEDLPKGRIRLCYSIVTQTGLDQAMFPSSCKMRA